jgi:hypothetical protein
VSRQPASPSGSARGRKTAHTTLLALRVGITLLASLGGAVLYLGLVDSGMNGTLAVLLGLGFALLSRQAASSLLVDALVRRARQSRADPRLDGRSADPRSQPTSAPR